MNAHSPKVPTSPTLAQSRYDRSATRVGIVHLGVGAFHRAHQAVYIDRLMDLTGDLNWSIAGVNLRAAQSMDLARLQAAGGQYVLKTLAPDGGVNFRLVRSHKGFYDWATDPESAEEIVAHPDVNIISITVTESGYHLAEDGLVDLSSPEIEAELAGQGHETIYGYLRKALNRRRLAGSGRVTVLCCDNLRDNGMVLRNALLSYLEAAGDDGLIDWLESCASFPCSMVDRITPRPDPANAEDVRIRFGKANDPTVHSEDYLQWVIEDDFRGLRPELSSAGVQLVQEVRPYEEAKIRILNGGHTGLVYLAALHGYASYDAALADPGLREFFDRFETMEVIRSLDTETPVDLEAYLDTVRKRLLNRHIADNIERIAMDGVSKFPVFVVPTVRECFARGITPECSMRAIASWYLFMRHAQEGKSIIRYVEPKWSKVKAMLAPGREESFARHPELWADLPTAYPAFVTGVCSGIADLAAQFPPA